MLSGVIRSTSGSCLVGNQSMQQGDMAYFQSLIGLCAQEDLLLSGFTALEHIRFLCDFCGIDYSRVGIRAYATKLLHKVGLDDEIDVQVQKFSGGMKRRLSLLMSVIGSKPIIFLDEPTTGLVAQIVFNLRTLYLDKECGN